MKWAAHIRRTCKKRWSHMNLTVKIMHFRLKGSTLIEVVTASVIFMIVFIMTMDILTRLSVRNNEKGGYLVMECDLKSAAAVLGSMELYEGEKTFHYQWGDVRAGITPYRENIYRIDMLAVPAKGRQGISYTFLLANKNNDNN